DTAPYHLFVLDLASLAVEQLTDEPDASDVLPRFRPDGKHIVFARAHRQRPYSLGGWYNRYPDFFPDGDRILFLAGMDWNAGSRPIYSLWEVSLAGATTEIASSDLFTNPANW